MVFQIGNKDDLAINKPECVCACAVAGASLYRVVWVALSGGRRRERVGVRVGVCLSILELHRHIVMGGTLRQIASSANVVVDFWL